MQKQAAANQKKRDVIGSMLDRGMLTIVVDATRPGVNLPAHLLQDPKVYLNLSHNFRTLIELKEDALHTVLSFNQRDFNCVIPWETIWAAQQGDVGFIDPDCLPGRENVFTVPPEKVLDERPSFEAIEGGAEYTPPRTGHLRVLH